LRSSPAIWFELPSPLDPKLSVPGFALASAMSSLRFFAGSEGCAASTFAPCTHRAMGSKSRSVSYGSFAKRLMLIAFAAPPMSSV
jgi:hypothetical protein